jgi:hypothetical protein
MNMWFQIIREKYAFTVSQRSESDFISVKIGTSVEADVYMKLELPNNWGETRVFQFINELYKAI